MPGAPSHFRLKRTAEKSTSYFRRETGRLHAVISRGSKIAPPVLQDRQCEMRFGVIRIDFQRAFKCAPRVIAPAQTGIDAAELQMHSRKLRLRRLRAFEMRQR